VNQFIYLRRDGFRDRRMAMAEQIAAPSWEDVKQFASFAIPNSRSFAANQINWVAFVVANNVFGEEILGRLRAQMTRHL
jgi:hypothetical protein